MGHRSRSALGVAALALLGCGGPSLPTGGGVAKRASVGDQGQVTFAYLTPGSDGTCSPDCGFGMPLLAGDTEWIVIDPAVSSPSAVLPQLAFNSSDETVLDVLPKLAASPYYSGERTTSLRGVAQGSATLHLFDATTGRLVDSATVRVDPAASISLSFETLVPGTPISKGDLVFAVGQEAAVFARVTDSAGELLAAWSGFSLEVADTSVASVQLGSVKVVTALAPGQTTLTARAGSAMTAVTVTVH
jgi:hypothetical protein